MADFRSVFGTITPPKEFGGITGEAGINKYILIFVTFIFTLSAVMFVFMVLYSAYQMIASGGDKEGVARARARITYAVIGLILLAFSFVIFRIVEQITGFKIIL